VIKELAYYTRRRGRRRAEAGAVETGRVWVKTFRPRFFRVSSAAPNRAEENAHLCADSRGGVAERRTSFRVFFFLPFFSSGEIVRAAV